jgi:hypothetical protein
MHHQMRVTARLEIVEAAVTIGRNRPRKRFPRNMFGLTRQVC